MRTSQVNNESQWNRTIRITNNSVPGGLRWQHRQGPERQKAQPRRVSLGHCGGRPHRVPLGVTPVVPVSGVHTYAVSSIMGSPTQSRTDMSLWGHSIDDRAPLRGPLSSPTLLSLRWPRCEHLKLPDRWAQRLPGTGEHCGFRGQVSTGASGDRWALGPPGTGEHWGLGAGTQGTAEPGDLDDRLPAELPPDSWWVSRQWLFKASRGLSDLLYRTLQHHGWI